VTQLPITVYESGYYNVKIIDMHGKTAALLYDGFKQKGKYVIAIEGGNMPSGAYNVVVTSGTQMQVKMIALVK
jgi:hypothetical protein